LNYFSRIQFPEIGNKRSILYLGISIIVEVCNMLNYHFCSPNVKLQRPMAVMGAGRRWRLFFRYWRKNHVMEAMEVEELHWQDVPLCGLEL
jgi:hypothetical protein